MNFSVKDICLKSTSQKNKYIALILILVVVLVSTGLVVSKKHHTNNRKTDILKTDKRSPMAGQEIKFKLQTMADQLNAIEKNLNSKSSYIDLNRANQTLSLVKTEVDSLQENTQKIVASEIKKSNHSLEEEIKQLSAQLNADRPKFIKAKDLPFKVLALDTIEHQSVVTIYYVYKRFPIEIGDNVAGWTLTRADIAKRQLQFSKDNKRVLYNVPN